MVPTDHWDIGDSAILSSPNCGIGQAINCLSASINYRRVGVVISCHRRSAITATSMSLSQLIEHLVSDMVRLRATESHDVFRFLAH